MFILYKINLNYKDKYYLLFYQTFKLVFKYNYGLYYI